jgi:hypothetical protein
VISFWKILLVVLVLAGVWAAVAIYKRNARQRELDEAAAQPKVAHVNTVACRVCGTYVPERGASRCGRADCPV